VIVKQITPKKNWSYINEILADDESEAYCNRIISEFLTQSYKELFNYLNTIFPLLITFQDIRKTIIIKKKGESSILFLFRLVGNHTRAWSYGGWQIEYYEVVQNASILHNQLRDEIMNQRESPFLKMDPHTSISIL